MGPPLQRKVKPKRNRFSKGDGLGFCHPGVEMAVGCRNEGTQGGTFRNTRQEPRGVTRLERTGGWGEGDPGDQGWGSGRHKGQRTRHWLVHVRGEGSRRRENRGRHAGLRKLRLRGAREGGQWS